MTETKHQSNTSEKPSFKRGEKVIVILFILAIITLTLKSTILDEVKNLPVEEQKFKDFVEYSVEEEYSGALADLGLIVYRVYDINMENPDEKGILRYKDPNTGDMIEVVQDDRYSAKVRGYLLWILPIQHFTITSQIVE